MKKILLIGGRRKAKALANSLVDNGYHVTVINNNSDDCRMLAEVKNISVFNGDGTKPYILEEIEAYNYDIAIALTSSDEANLVICELCKKKFNIKKTVTLLSDIKKIEFFYKMGIDRVVCATSTISNIIEQNAFMDDITNIIQIGDGRVKILEIPIMENYFATNKKVWELNLPQDVIIGSILRSSTTVVPRGDTVILHNDIMVLISTNNREDEAVKIIKTGE